MRLSGVMARTRTIVFACNRCKRWGRYTCERLILKFGDVTIWEMFDLLAADCPRYGSEQYYNRCGIHSPTLSELAGLAKMPARG